MTLRKMRNVITARPPLPDSLAATVALRPYFAELDERRGEAIALRREIESLRRAERTAAETDKAAAVAALRTGKADPGDRELKSVKDRAAQLQRQAGIVAGAQGAVVADIDRELVQPCGNS
jgi:hypothetical protein